MSDAPAVFQATFADWRTVKGRKLPLYKRGRTPKETIETYSMPVTETGCWIWLGSRQCAGLRYGTATVGGRQIKAHRASYEAYNGPIPEGMCVCHKCDVTLCVNPDHLFVGTQLDNAQDRERKGRGGQPSGLRNGRYTKPWRTARGERHGCHNVPGWKQGTKNGRAVLTEADVLVIRDSTEPSRALGRHYGVSKTTILKIRRRMLWGHL